MGGVGDEFGVVEQGTFGRRESRLIEFAFENRRNALIGGSLNTQEVGVAVESIRAPVQKRDVARDHFLVAASEMAGGEVNCVRKLNDLAQKIWPRSEAFDNSRHLAAAGSRSPEIIGCGGIARSFGVLSDADFRGRIWSLGGVASSWIHGYILSFGRHSFRLHERRKARHPGANIATPRLAGRPT
jgi:hypothetical protein